MVAVAATAVVGVTGDFLWVPDLASGEDLGSMTEGIAGLGE